MSDRRFSQGTLSFRRFWAGSLLALALSATGCFGAHYRPSYSMQNVQAKPASLMVAQKIQRPLFLVVDSAKVPDSWDLKESSSLNPKDGEQTKLIDFQQFVRRDLKEALGNYFAKVEVVKAGTPLPAEPHVVADVKVDRVQLHSTPVGRLVYTIIEMTWGVGLRPSEQAEYAFAFAGEGKSSESYPTFEVGVAQLVESAILGFNKSLVEKGGLEALQKASAPAAPQAAAAANPAGGAVAQAGGEPLDLAAPGKPASKAGKKRSK